MDSHADVVVFDAESIEDLDGLVVTFGCTAIATTTAERIEAVLPSWPQIFEGDDDG